MRLENIFLFSGALRNLFRRSSAVFLVCIRAVVILFKWRKKVRVESLQINDGFLLTNGFIIIKWRIRNLLWVRINKKIVTLSRDGIVLHFSRIKTPIDIKVIGLFGRYHECFHLSPHATINSNRLQLPKLKGEKFSALSFGSALDSFTPRVPVPQVYNQNFTSRLEVSTPAIDVQLSSFNKDEYHE